MPANPASINSAPGVGPGLRTYDLGGGVQVPSVVLEALTAAGELIALRASGTGALAVSDESVTQGLADLLANLASDAVLKAISTKVGEVSVAPSSGTVLARLKELNDSLQELVSQEAGAQDVIDRAGRILGHVQVDNFPATQAVTGDFWQTTQPVSGPLTDTQLRASAVGIDITAASKTQLPSASGGVIEGPYKFHGMSVRETSGTTPAVFRLKDGTTNSGGLFDTVSLAAGESLREWYAPIGKNVTTGIYYELVSGAVEGVIFTR